MPKLLEMLYKDDAVQRASDCDAGDADGRA